MIEEEFMKLMDVKSTADLLTISESMVYKLAANRELTCVRIGDCVRFRQDDIDNYIQKNTKQKEDTEDVQRVYLF
jgi:excisionase family DNA binding protein